jgi:hypothetical protein
MSKGEKIEYIEPIETPRVIEDELARLHAVLLGDGSTNTKNWAKEAISKIHEVLLCRPMVVREVEDERG